ncbi:MAG: hypothetical protein ACOC54_04580 [Candidatus Sumerlaeota bacterium]
MFRVIPLFFFLVFFVQQSFACVTPVYRYALERWTSDSYRVTVFYRGALSEDDYEKLAPIISRSRRIYGHYTDSLEKYIQHDEKANISIRFANLDEDLSSGTLLNLEENAKTRMPWVVLRYPRAAGLRHPMWSGELENLQADSLLDSPMRQKVADLLIEGETAVWVLLETGDKEKDAAALERLKSGLEYAKASMKLPEVDPEIAQGDLIERSKEIWRISFPVVSVSRADMKEVPFMTMLIKTEPRLMEHLQEPMVFPVFGQGRALPAFLGDEINDEKILEAASFLTGSCECEVKDQNPGKDMLIMAAWEQAQRSVIDEAIPDLAGLDGFSEEGAACCVPGLADDIHAKEDEIIKAAEATIQEASIADTGANKMKKSGFSKVMKPLAIAIAGAGLLIGLVSLGMGTRRRQNR